MPTKRISKIISPLLRSPPEEGLEPEASPVASYIGDNIGPLFEDMYGSYRKGDWIGNKEQT